MVAASEKTTVSEIDRAGKELADHTTVLGVVLNKCRFMGDQDGYSYAGY
jgi:Mrp family chromosome partitioning ATPase